MQHDDDDAPRLALVEVPRRSKNVVGLLVRLGKTFLPFQVAFLDGFGRRMAETREVDGLSGAQGRAGVDELVVGGVEVELPFEFGSGALEGGSDALVEALDLLKSGETSILVELDGRLDLARNTLLEGGLLLLEADEGGLKVVLLVDLLLHLVLNDVVGEVGVLLRKHLSRGVLEGVDAGLKLEKLALRVLALEKSREVSRRLESAVERSKQTHLLVNLVSDSTRLLLNRGDLSLDVGADTLELANDGRLDGLGEVGVDGGEGLGVVCVRGRVSTTIGEKNEEKLGTYRERRREPAAIRRERKRDPRGRAL
jgi:hypothetical protein